MFDLTFYLLIFLSVYVQVFFFVTFLENRRKIVTRIANIKLKHYPAVTIAVPIFNEEKTVAQTINSILKLNYPKDKLKLILVDDGSTDKSFDVISRFARYPNIKILQKANGGKHTALNLALEHTDTEFFGGIDADSFAHPESLVRMLEYFERGPEIMAVAPSVTVHEPKNFIQHAQKTEYHMGIYFKKMLCFLDAINVTPGPMTIFRKKVFEDLGHYREGHNTEDMEIAYRMQKHGYRIENCNDAYVFTNTPSSVRKLFRQRLRWIYGFINNTIDYRDVLFRKKYGNFAFFTLPMGIISIISVCYLFFRIVYNFFDFLYLKITTWEAVGLHLSNNIKAPDLFFLNVNSYLLLVVFIYTLILFAIIFGRKMAKERRYLSLRMLYFFPVFGIVAPFWLLKAVYNTILTRKPDWR